jgi:hypothetical protein
LSDISQSEVPQSKRERRAERSKAQLARFALEGRIVDEDRTSENRALDISK